ncbi:MAG: P-loop NTPase [Myxococcales bacterium]
MRIARAQRVISVGGGKGGVGKSIVAANLAVAMAQAGAKVVVVDADLGAANQHTLFGIDRAVRTLHGLFDKSVERLEDTLLETCAPGVSLVPGSSGVVGAANIGHQQKLKLIRHIRALSAEVVIIDVGAGVSYNVLDLFDAADLRLVVMTPQLTSLQNGYAFLKGAVFRELRRLADGAEQEKLVEESPEASAATRRVPDLVERVRHKDPAFAGRLLSSLTSFGARVVGNQVFEAAERGVLQAVSRMTSDFLGVDAPVVATLKASRRVHDSIQDRRPFMLAEASDETSAAVRGLAGALLAADVAALRRSREAVEGREVVADHAEDEPLPSALSPYQRRWERHAVLCQATLISNAGTSPVRIVDVSEGGARLALERPPVPGTRAVLIVSALSERPSLPCIVRHSDAGSGQCGVEFQADAALAARVAADIVRRFASIEPNAAGPGPRPTSPNRSHN